MTSVKSVLPQAAVASVPAAPLLSREWAMPSAQTFSIKPIENLLKRYITTTDVVIDPFARSAKWGTITNDLNPEMPTDYHMDAVSFCELLQDENVVADAILFDPPYSPRQVSEVYQAIGRECSMRETQTGRLYREVRDALHLLLRKGGLAVSFGWNSAGMGKKRGYETVEILLVAHGGAHNDTIVVVERKL